MYDFLFRTVLKRLDPEFAHSLAFAVIRALPALGVGKLFQRSADPSLRVETLGNWDSATLKSEPSRLFLNRATRSPVFFDLWPTAG